MTHGQIRHELGGSDDVAELPQQRSVPKDVMLIKTKTLFTSLITVRQSHEIRTKRTGIVKTRHHGHAKQACQIKPQFTSPEFRIDQIRLEGHCLGPHGFLTRHRNNVHAAQNDSWPFTKAECPNSTSAGDPGLHEQLVRNFGPPHRWVVVHPHV